MTIMKRGIDHLHFTAEGYRQFGKRYAEKMLSILGYKINENASPTTPPAAGTSPATASGTDLLLNEDA